jgi:hypothetical protein
MRWNALTAATLLLAACGGGDDPPVDEPEVGANLVVTFNDGRVDTLSWPVAWWSQEDTPGSGRLLIAADGAAEGPPSPEVHSLYSLMASFRGPRFTSVPGSFSLGLGVTGTDSASIEIIGSGGIAIQEATLGVERLSHDLIRLTFDATRTEGVAPFHVTGVIVAAPQQ